MTTGNMQNWFTFPDNLDQQYLIPVGTAINIGDLCYDGGSGVAKPAGAQASQGSEAADQVLFAKGFIGCATDGCLSSETNAARQIVVRTEGVKAFNCPSQSFTPGDLLGVYSDGTNPPDPQKLDACSNPQGAIAVVIPCPGNPLYYASAVTVVYAMFISRHGGSELSAQLLKLALPPAKFGTLNQTTGSLPAGAITGAQMVYLLTTNATPGAQLVRSAAAMLADMGAKPGQCIAFRIINSGAGTLTLTADAGATVTLTGTMTVAQNTTRDFTLTFNTATTATIQSVGTGTI